MPFQNPPQRLLVTLAVAAVAGLGAGATTAHAAAPSKLAVASPTGESLQTGLVQIKVDVPAGATDVTARLGGKTVTLQGTGAVRTASVPVKTLKPGRATVAIRARGADHKALFAHADFTVGTPTPSLLKAGPTVTTANGTAALQLNLATRPSNLKLELNGKRVPLLRMPTTGATSLPLAADDGLRFGANALTLSAYDRKSGKWARFADRFKMSTKTPLVSAGRDVQVTAGADVKLSASATRTRSAKTPLGYAWKIVSEPKGANAKLVGANTEHPSVKTTDPGRYRIQLALDPSPGNAQAASAGNALTDTVSVDAAASVAPYGAPITTLVPNSDGATTRTTIQGIPINGGNDYVDTPNTKVGMIVLDRATLEATYTQVNPDIFSINQARATVGADQIAIMSGAPGASVEVPWAPILTHGAGWTAIFAGENSTSPIVANIGNTVVGSKTSGPRDSGAISGVIRKSHTLGSQGSDVYTYASTDAIPFDSHMPSSYSGYFSMQLGSNITNYPNAQGIAVSAVDPDLKSYGWSQWFPLTGDATADQTTLENLATELKYNASSDPGSVLELQTNGNPKAHTTAWGDMASALQVYGGTPTVWDELDGTGNYALIGRAGAGATTELQASASAEASAPLESGDMNDGAKATAGTLRGVIGRGPDSLPNIGGSTSLPTATSKDANGNPIQVNPFELTALADAAPQAWPLSDPASTAALQYISQQLSLGDPDTDGAGLCYHPTTWDLRAEYCNANESGSWSSTIKDQMNDLSYPPGASYSQDQFNAVRAELAKEFGMINPVFTMIGQLQAPITNSQAQTAVDITDTATAVDNSLSTADTSGNFNMQSFVSDFLGPMQDLAEPDDATGMDFGIGLFASALDMALSSVTDDSGNPALDTFDSDKATIGNDAVSRLTAASGQMALVEQMLLTDYTKLSTTAAYAKNVWSLNSWVADGQTSVVEAGTRSWLYQTELPIAYSQIVANPSQGTNADGLHQITCAYNGGSTYYDRWPFIPGATPDFHGNPSGGTPLPDSAVLTPITGTNADGSPVTSVVFGLGNATGNEGLQTPSSDLTDSLFRKIGTTDQNGNNPGIGLYPQQFYSWGWLSANRYQFSDIQKNLNYPASCHQ
jgi:hypothetical protein